MEAVETTRALDLCKVEKETPVELDKQMGFVLDHGKERAGLMGGEQI